MLSLIGNKQKIGWFPSSCLETSKVGYAVRTFEGLTMVRTAYPTWIVLSWQPGTPGDEWVTLWCVSESARPNPLALVREIQDAEGEVRLVLVGLSNVGLLLTVVYALHGEDSIRLI